MKVKHRHMFIQMLLNQCVIVTRVSYVLCILVPRYIHVMAEETNQEASTTDIFAIVYIDMLNCFLVVKVKIHH